jgi:tryptophan halogenase
MFGQGIVPQSYHQFVDTMSDKELPLFLNSLKQKIQLGLEKLPSHQAFIDNYCKAKLSG